MRTQLTVLLAASLLLPAATAAQELSARAADIRIGGRLHTQYAASSVDGEPNEFFFRRARLVFDVTLNDMVDGRVQPDFGGGKTSLKDAYFRVRLAPELRIAMGKFKRSFDLFELASDVDLSIIERDGRVAGVDDCAGVGGVCSYGRLTAKLEFGDRDTGIRIDGSRGRVSWQASMTNGIGEEDENDAKSYAGRLSVDLSDQLVLSGQLGVHDYVGLDEGTETAAAWGADLQYGDFLGGPLLQAGVVGGENWKALDELGQAPDFFAFQAVGSIYVPVGSGDGLFTGVEPLARVSFADPNTTVDDDGAVIFTPGLMFYVEHLF